MSGLQAGTAEVDITPSLGCHLCGQMDDRIANDVRDPLHAKALVLTDGETTLGFVVCDLIVVPAAVVDAAKDRIRELTGVPPENVLISGTHTHTGPAIIGAFGTPEEEGYGESIVPKIADALALAVNRLQPAQMAAASGDCADEVHNRRWHMKDGSVVMNPGYLNPDNVRPAGPVDPELGLLILRTPDGTPLGLLGCLGLHYVGSQEQYAVSADYFAEFGRAVRRFAGADFPAILANGCSGNINNCDFSKPARGYPHPNFQVERVANVVAAEAWKAWNLMREEDFRSDVSLGARTEMVPFKARMPLPEELAAARKLYESKPALPEAEWLYARELVLLSEGPRQWEVPIQAMRVGDLGVVGLPGEVFCEIGLDIKARSPMDATMTVGLANGTVGYVATDEAIDQAGYETRICRHVRSPKGTAGLWADTAVRLLDGLA